VTAVYYYYVCETVNESILFTFIVVIVSYEILEFQKFRFSSTCCFTGLKHD